jgi:DNA polymerase III epsilon subunit-like protein
VRAWVAEVKWYRQAARWNRRPCPPCAEVRRVEAERRQAEYQAGANRRAEEDRKRRAEAKAARVAELQELARWAAAQLADPQVRILDSETTGLHDQARIVELAVITTAGETLIDTLLDPGEPIPTEASDIHGITDSDVAGAPSFAAILPELQQQLHGHRVLIYNAPYDLGSS